MEDIISALKNEAQLLTNKIAKYQQIIESAAQERERRETVSTYTNLIRALQEVLTLIDKYDWELKYSEYHTDCHKEVAVWEQNSQGDIRKHKKWIAKDIKEDKDKKYREWSSKYATMFDFQHNMGLPRTVFKITDDIRGIGKTSWLVNKANKTGGYYVSKYIIGCKHAIDMGCENTLNANVENWYIGIPKNRALFIDEDVFTNESDLKKFKELNKDREYFIFYRVK